jgi:putative ABC transport system substrate-binding protein
LREHGYVEGRNLVVVRRYGELDGSRIRSSAQELAAMQLDAIVTSCASTTSAAVKAAGQTPVVIGSISDPVRHGLVQSLARPGGTVTGRMSMSLDLLPKRLQLLRLVVPPSERAGARVAVLMIGGDASQQAQWAELQGAARSLELQLVQLAIGGPGGLEKAFDALADARPHALLVLSDNPVMIEHRARIADAAIRLRLPSISGARMYVQSGGLLSYGTDIPDDFRASADHVVRVANGTSPAGLPVAQPTLFQLAVNLRTAREIGVTIPAELRLRANSTIE